MSDNTANGSADRLRKEALALHRALDGGLDSALQAEGFELLGLSLKVGAGDCLLTLRVANHTGKSVAFVGSTDAIKCITKAYREVRGAKLLYREDRFGA